jgi:hypothetical protein
MDLQIISYVSSENRIDNEDVVAILNQHAIVHVQDISIIMNENSIEHDVLRPVNRVWPCRGAQINALEQFL